MSRVIKFRAWDKVENRMCRVRGVNFAKSEIDLAYREDTLRNSDKWILNYPLADVEIMQFTGLHDKNGKEIYGGDIVKNATRKARGLWLGKIQEYETIVTTDVVKFDEHWCAFSFTSRIERGELEVIGNIHENPELLEAEA